jgi:uncharacterized membrane protein
MAAEAVLIPSMRSHFLHHIRFYLSLLLGLVVWAFLQAFPLQVLPPPLPTLLGGNAFFGTYLVLTTILALYEQPSRMRSRASVEDEGFILIVIMTLVAVGLSIGSIFALLNNQSGKVGHVGLFLSVANVPLGWLTLHVTSAFHYAHLYYQKEEAKEGKRRDKGGLQFPETKEPVMWDFFYFSFVVGMTSQTSDVDVVTTGMRRQTLLHSIVSFFYNTVLVALAVNVVVAQAQ